MGCCSSKDSSTAFEATLVKNVTATAFATEKKPASFNQILLKLPKVAANFERVKSLYRQYDKDGNGGISIGEMKAAFKEMGASISDARVEEYFKEADLDKTNLIKWKEFLLCLSFCYFVDIFDFAEHSEEFMDLFEAFQVCAQAFAFFDSNHGGSISRIEVEKAISGGEILTPDSKGKGNKVWSAGSTGFFEKYDLDNSGMISFKEFLVALVDFSGAGKEDEDEE